MRLLKDDKFLKKKLWQNVLFQSLKKSINENVHFSKGANLLTPAKIDYDRVVRIDNERCEYSE